jgi:hypothetical protein
MGRDGTKWDEHRSRGRGRAKIARIAMIAKIAEPGTLNHKGHEEDTKEAKPGTPPRAVVPHGNRGRNGKVAKEVK